MPVMHETTQSGYAPVPSVIGKPNSPSGRREPPCDNERADSLCNNEETVQRSVESHRTRDANCIRHQVTGADTLASVAHKYGVSPAAVRRANGLTSSEFWFKKVLLIPIPDGDLRLVIPPPVTAEESQAAAAALERDKAGSLARLSGACVRTNERTSTYSIVAVFVATVTVFPLASRGPFHHSTVGGIFINNAFARCADMYVQIDMRNSEFHTGWVEYESSEMDRFKDSYIDTAMHRHTSVRSDAEGRTTSAVPVLFYSQRLIDRLID
eukprot:GHVU01150928.1.p1 GENE.GHVU01150928.1~~GHVU01150928.1.p1  ORF type:complete len:268 (+),score=7.99 GHVU01150928.1:486-1289(+)